jgi:hypothetical protein
MRFFLPLLIFIMATSYAQANEDDIFREPQSSSLPTYAQWSERKSADSWAGYHRLYLKKMQEDRTQGLSYVISGSLAIAGGLVGDVVTKDPIEKGIYALFQTIGIASVGYGAYKWKVGDSDRQLIETLQTTQGMNDQDRVVFLKNYYAHKKEYEKQERFIKAITHGMIAALNFYNSSQQKQEGVKNTLLFIGGANFLASMSYTF